jgi:hypothetical protein
LRPEACLLIRSLPDLFLCGPQVLPDLLFSPEAAALRQGLYVGAVMHDALQHDQPFGAHDAEHLYEEPVQGLLVEGTEVSEGVIVDWFHAGEPLVSGIMVAETGDLPGGTNALTVGVDPDAKEQPRVEGRATCLSFYGVDRPIIQREVKMAVNS